VLSRLHGETNRLLASADVREKIGRVGGLEPFISTPEEFAALIHAEYLKYGEVVKAVGATID
jgi:tripartite-type tricarboxylate transporter receptor subunit TctC